MKKQSVALTEVQAWWLDREAARLGISVGELVRRMVDAYRDASQRFSYQAMEEREAANERRG